MRIFRINNLLILFGLALLMFGTANVLGNFSTALGLHTPAVQQGPSTGALQAARSTPTPFQPVKEEKPLPSPTAIIAGPTIESTLATLPSPTPGPTLAPTPVPTGEVPLMLSIPAINLSAPIEPAEVDFTIVDGISYQEWLAPNKFAVGWHADSALLGLPGNTVLNGHHNINGEVFGHLVDLKTGDYIMVYSEHNVYIYQVSNYMIVPEKYETLDIRMDNARWILPSTDERLTLITCWPKENNTHRLIIVAYPVAHQPLTPLPGQ